VITVLQRRTYFRQQPAEALLSFNERSRADLPAIEVEEVEQKEDERIGVACI